MCMPAKSEKKKINKKKKKKQNIKKKKKKRIHGNLHKIIVLLIWCSNNTTWSAGSM